ncbi:MAG TPA: type II secretion system protein [Virgibacillus sp.]|nr:type II secretion system protein [Virgibacillus sp.]
MSKNNGFTLVEVLVASSIILMMVTTLLPISLLLYQERLVLSDQRTIHSQLHDELQAFLWTDQLALPVTYFKDVHSIHLHFRFERKGDLIKGCVQWENARRANEEFCIYGADE